MIYKNIRLMMYANLKVGKELLKKNILEQCILYMVEVIYHFSVWPSSRVPTFPITFLHVMPECKQKM